MSATAAFLPGGGELGAIVRAYDWATTPLGPIARWSQSLRSAVSTVLLSPVPIVLLWGADGIMIYNDAYSVFAGGRHPQLLGSKVREGWPEVADFNDNVMRVGLAGGTLSYKDQELTLHRYGRPEQVWMNLDYSPVLDEAGQPAGVIAVVVETTERVLAEQRLTASQALAQLYADRIQLALSAGAIIGTWVWDLPADAFTVDEAFARSFGLDPALGRVGLSLEQVIATVHPEDRQGLIAAINEVIARGGAYAHQYRVRRTDGKYYWIEANGRVDRAPDGTPLSFPGVLINVEDRRAVEAERDRAIMMLRTLTDTLEQRVAERTSELMRTEDALRQSQKMEAVGQLTGGVAHDFNNLLTIIRSSVDFLRRPDLPEARKARYLDAVSDTVDRAAKLTGQLLAFARRQALKPEVFHVGQKVRGIADMLDTVIGARVRVIAEVPDEPCHIRADVSQFETALVNMAVNARDAMNGEGTLTLRLAGGRTMPAIHGHAGADTAFVAVSLTDTGAGISEADLGRLFEPFFTTKEVGKGTGLGLSQVFGFAKQSGGNVDVTSAPGQGATFTLYLPQVEVDRRIDEAEGVPATISPLGTGQRVLVVEDNVEVGQFATQILQDLGYETVWAANAEAALERLGRDGGGFEVVFSDVVMPGMGGLALAQELARRLPELPVLLTSGYSHVLAQEGTHGFELLHKPYSADQLGRVLSQVLGRPAPASAE
ncbi:MULTISPECIES: ATP-binding protein [Methylobacterium]|uniref:ATP-binding protein n=1 Tax=Methylobacterium TaxID=407 RepID=UPI0011C820DD|nr:MULTISPECIES: ATP-binding protein [Methylobacterium]TXN46671.1 PAS domain-containing protein [Methylobacterium sp. WL7]TXN74245.1 PAS domain-containing protein [Methylobacterium sp. WL18]GJE24360.1 Sensor histidine kinase RcsC [Methylobacterium mesophilicum]